MSSTPVKVLEKDIARQVCDFLRARGWRPIRTNVVAGPGYGIGEPGMPDYLMLHYQPNGRALVLWIEFKGPNDKRRCTCQPGKQCKPCRQKAWHVRERQRGASVAVVDDLQWFIDEYEKAYGWLHTGDTGRGQLNLLAGVQG